MRYRQGQRLKQLATESEFVVEETPDTFSAFGKSLYLLHAVSGKAQVALETADLESRLLYVPLPPYLPVPTPPKFNRHCLIKEVATGIISIVIGMPEDNRLTDTFEPAYTIQGPDALRWPIAQITMENGSYVAAHGLGRQDCDAM